tara:strand:+ start:74 stop:265 length:192 start_codon:yes stop_codon:yes gene_type:complete
MKNIAVITPISHLEGINEFDDLTKSPIIKAMNEGENIIVTPHIGGMTIEGQTKAYRWAIDKLS